MKNTLHVISHTHWDREWYRTFQEFRLKLVTLVDGLLDILEKDPEFKYFMLDGQTIVLEDYLLMRPEKEGILRDHIQKGRLVIGPWHILPDMFLVSPESHIRNLLQGERTARKFGPKMMVGYMPDSFGHISQMPQILQGFEIDKACLWRGLDEEPTEFWWQSPDGSQVLMAYLRESYSNGAYLPGGESGNPSMPDMNRFAESIDGMGKKLAENSSASNHLIMLGTDHMRPSPDTSANIAFADEILPETQVAHSTLQKYFDDLLPQLQKSDLPVLIGELRACRRMPLLPGVLSTRIWIKQRNSYSENLLTNWVEPFSTFASWLDESACETQTGTKRINNPSGLIRQAWKMLMENHPHDSICGCSIDQVHDEMKVRFDQVDQVGEELTRQSLETLADRITTHNEFGNQPSFGSIIVFNPTQYDRTDLVSIEVNVPAANRKFQLVCENGENIPYETRGMGAAELLNSLMTPPEFKSAFNMVSEGRVSGYGIRAFEVLREGSKTTLDITLADQEPDRLVWEKALSEINSLLNDAEITRFHVRAHTPSISRIVFSANDVPGLGWRVFHLLADPDTNSTPTQLPAAARFFLPVIGLFSKLPAGEKLLAQLQKPSGKQPEQEVENEFFKVKVESSGTLSILDKRTGILHRGMNQFLDGGDAGDEYNYSPPAEDKEISSELLSSSVTKGEVTQSLLVQLCIRIPVSLSADRRSRSLEFKEIPVTTRITLGRSIPRIDILTTVNNSARDHRLRVHFPASIHTANAFHDSHFEVLSRSTAIPDFDRDTWIEDPRPEVPQRAFTTISDDHLGLTIANRGLPEVQVIQTANGSEIALTLLRCVGWLSRDDFSTRRGHAGPAMETPGAQMSGTWDFHYSIIPHPAADLASAANLAYEFNQPMRAVTSSDHAGPLPANGSFVKINSIDTIEVVKAQPFVLSSIKEMDDGSGWLLRGYNPGSSTLQVNITPLMFTGNGRKNTNKYCAKINLAEQFMEEVPVDKLTGSINLPVHGKQIVSVFFGSKIYKL